MGSCASGSNPCHRRSGASAMKPVRTSTPLAPWALLAGVLLSSGTGARASGPEPTLEAFLGRWVAEAGDYLCGTRRLGKLAHPAVVRFDELLQATPEMREVKRKGIAPDSAQGQVLAHKAKTRVIKACEKLRKAGRHCSVWRAIRHEDGRCVPDLTRAIKAAL